MNRYSTRSQIAQLPAWARFLVPAVFIFAAIVAAMIVTFFLVVGGLVAVLTVAMGAVRRRFRPDPLRSPSVDGQIIEADYVVLDREETGVSKPKRIR